MEGNVWRPAHLTPEQMEERRLAAAVLLRQGRLSQAEIARQLGVSRASVWRWAATLAQQGLDPTTVDLAGADLALAARQTPAIPHDEFGQRTMNVVSPGRGSPPGQPAKHERGGQNWTPITPQWGSVFHAE